MARKEYDSTHLNMLNKEGLAHRLIFTSVYIKTSIFTIILLLFTEQVSETYPPTFK